jgi:hypothetical protein
MWADIQAQAADRNALFLLHLPEILVAGHSIEMRFPGLLLIKNPPVEHVPRADIHTCRTCTALLLHRSAGRGSGASVRTVTQWTRGPCSGVTSRQLFPIQPSPARCVASFWENTPQICSSSVLLDAGTGKAPLSRMLEHVCNTERNLIEGLVHDIIAVVLVEDRCRFVVIRQG